MLVRSLAAVDLHRRVHRLSYSQQLHTISSHTGPLLDAGMEPVPTGRNNYTEVGAASLAIRRALCAPQRLFQPSRPAAHLQPRCACLVPRGQIPYFRFKMINLLTRPPSQVQTVVPLPELELHRLLYNRPDNLPDG